MYVHIRLRIFDVLGCLISQKGLVPSIIIHLHLYLRLRLCLCVCLLVYQSHHHEFPYSCQSLMFAFIQINSEKCFIALSDTVAKAHLNCVKLKGHFGVGLRSCSERNCKHRGTGGLGHTWVHSTLIPYIGYRLTKGCLSRLKRIE